MELTNEELKNYLFDFDNHSELENITFLNEAFDEDVNLRYWTKLLEHNFDDEQIEPYFDSLTKEDRELYFKFGVKCILNFIQANFTGPPLTTLDNLFKKSLFKDFNFKNHLSVNGEEVNVNTKYLPLLCAALSIFRLCSFNLTLNLWWQWRTLMIHQKLLDELSPNLFDTTNQLHTKLQNFKFDTHFEVLLQLEQAQMYQMYRNIPKSEQHLNNARELLSIEHEMAGALGKRTKYQTRDLAQLQLTVKVSDRPRVHVNEFVIPENYLLDDDVVLDTVKFNADLTLPALDDLEQKYFFLYVKHMIISQPQDNLYYEEIKPFLDYLLSQNNTWAVRVAVLLMRCKLESANKRALQRCLLQCEEVVICIKKDEPQWINRIGGVFSTHFSPIWKMQEQLAELMLNTGLVKASLDIFLSLQLWEEVIVCYTLLKMGHKATEIIKQQLNEKPTVKLWCLLGDATNDVNCYKTAWELSQYRSSRPRRHWAEHFYYQRKYYQSIPHFEESLRINPLQVNTWLQYAFAALETQNWQAAASAYKQYTMLEPGNFQAWNNLAKTYIKLGNKKGAHQALHEAIKCNFDNWKVWDNLMVVSVDIKAFSDVINAYQRILDIKRKHLDLEVLQALIFFVTSSKDEPNLLLKRTQELFERLTGVYPMEGFLWELYSDLAIDSSSKIQILQRAHRAYTQIGWEKDLNSCQQVLRICDKLGKSILSDDIKSTDLLVNNVRLNLISSLSTIEKQQFPLDVNEINLLLQQVVEKCRSTHNV